MKDEIKAAVIAFSISFGFTVLKVYSYITIFEYLILTLGVIAFFYLKWAIEVFLLQKELELTTLENIWKYLNKKNK